MPQVQKHLLSSDWQPRIEADAPGEAARLQSVMDSIATQHPDLTHAHILGDLVTAATEADGVVAEYGYPEFLADWRTRLPIPLSKTFFLPGNHDRDGGGNGNWEGSFSMQTYRAWIGASYYYTLNGNLMCIYLGDMGGSGGGVITDAVAEWFATIVENNLDKIKLVFLHQPLSGTYQGKVEATDPTEGVQHGSSRITDVLDAHDTIAAVFHGHSGSAEQFNDETWHGTRHLQVGMHIPANAKNARNDQYYVMLPVDGSASMVIEQWDATADILLSSKTITFAYPLQVADEFTFDGRKQADLDAPLVRPLTINVPLDEFRELDNGVWDLQSDIIPVLRIGATDRSNDQTAAGLAIGIRWDWPGVSGYDDADMVAGNMTGAGWAYFERTAGFGTEPTLTYKVSGLTDGILTPFFNADVNGLHVGHDGSTTGNPGNNATVGASIHESGFVSAYKEDAISGYFGRGTDGAVIEINSGLSQVGKISISGASTVYSTTSDVRLKTDFQEFDGLATILALNVYDHGWNDHLGRSRGVVAQDAIKVAPHAVSTGGDDPKRAPWMVDYSKMVPDLIRAVQQQADQIKALESKLEKEVPKT